MSMGELGGTNRHEGVGPGGSGGTLALPHAPSPQGPYRLLSLLAGFLLGMAATGCIPSSPTYPFDIFPEMHYSPAYRPEEPPRLAPPQGSVPVTGRAPDLSRDQARLLQNPVAATPENLKRANDLVQINCRPCHGPNGRGDGFLASYFRAAGKNPPVDWAGPQERDLSDGEIWFIIGNGIRGMPPFGNLLTGEERWLLVDYIRSLEAEVR